RKEAAGSMSGQRRDPPASSDGLSDHPTSEQLHAFLVRGLSAEELLRVDRHLESCEACRQGLAGDPDPRLSTAGLREALLGDEDLSAAHPAYEELAAYVDGELAGAEREALAAHLEVCEPCRRSQLDLQALAQPA